MEKEVIARITDIVRFGNLPSYTNIGALKVKVNELSEAIAFYDELEKNSSSEKVTFCEYIAKAGIVMAIEALAKNETFADIANAPDKQS